MELSNESKTLFIPLYGKALMSKNKLFLNDIKAEEIIDSISFDFVKLKQSKWLSMYMATRAKIFDEICNEYIKRKPNITIIHLGCGLDSRCLRVKNNFSKWYDVDLPGVVEIRKKFYKEDNHYKMLGKSVTDLSWTYEIENEKSDILIIAEGLTMYLSEDEIKHLLEGVNKVFDNVVIVFDAYTKRAVKISKLKNPVKQVGASVKWGMDSISDFTALNQNLEFAREYLIKNKENNLKGITKFIFEKLYCGKISESLYKIYEFKLKK